MQIYRLIIFAVLLMCTVARGSGQLKVAFFLSPTCTICRFYALEMRNLSSDYGGKGVEFVGYAVGPLLNDSIVETFRCEYQIPFPVLHDDVMHRRLNATVTPEVFVIHNDSVMYHGRIDDSFVRVGKRRAHVKNRELRNALDRILQGGMVEINHVPAVGCIIEK
jgi:thiol-disulfide isomerase/thioredoxin